MLDGLQHSKLSYSSCSDSESPLHGLPTGSGLPSPDSERSVLAPHCAWEALLSTSLPFLLSESQAAADFLGLTKAEQHRPKGQATPPSMYSTPCYACLLLASLCTIPMKKSSHSFASSTNCANGLSRASVVICCVCPQMHVSPH